MKALKTRYLLMLAMAGAFSLTGCRKEKEEVTPEMTFESAEDNARIESESETSQNFIDIESADPNLRAGLPSQTNNLPACASRTWDAANSTLTINFGPNNCLCKDGRYRRGILTATFAGQWRTVGSSVTIKKFNYFVDDNEHFGTRVITFVNNENGSANYKYHVAVTGAGINFTDGSSRNWNAQRDIERIAGQGTPPITDDEYLVTGTSAGTNRRNVGFTTVIGQPLKKVFRQGCFRNFISGTVTITNSNNKTMLLNYDPANNEACDKTASVTANGKTRIIQLR